MNGTEHFGNCHNMLKVLENELEEVLRSVPTAENRIVEKSLRKQINEELIK